MIHHRCERRVIVTLVVVVAMALAGCSSSDTTSTRATAVCKVSAEALSAIGAAMTRNEDIKLVIDKVVKPVGEKYCVDLLKSWATTGELIDLTVTGTKTPYTFSGSTKDLRALLAIPAPTDPCRGWTLTTLHDRCVAGDLPPYTPPSP